MNNNLSSIIWLCIILVFTGVYFVSKAINNNTSPDPTRMTESTEDKYAAVAKAFESDTDAPAEASDAHKEIHQLFDKITTALQQPTAEQYAKLFEFGTMFAAAEQAGTLQHITARDRRDIVQAMEKGGSRAFQQLLDLYDWTGYEIKNIRFLNGHSEAVVIVRHIGSEMNAKMRWWVIRKGGDWRIYDIEDLDGGVRMSSMMGLAFSSFTRRGTPPTWLTGMKTLNVAIQELAAEDADGAAQSLARIKNVSFPRQIEGLRWMMVATIEMHQGELDNAMKTLDRAESFNNDMPILHSMRAELHVLKEQHAEAIVSADRYMELLGPSADMFLVKGQSLRALGQPAKAAAAFRAGLVDDAQSVDCLYELIVHHRTEGNEGEIAQEEIAAAIKKFEPIGPQFCRIAEGMIDHDELDSLRLALTSYHRLNQPYHQVTFYEGYLASNDEKHAEAAAFFKQAIAQAELPDDRENYAEWYYESAIAEGKAVEAYQSAQDKKHAYSYIATSLIDNYQMDELLAINKAHEAIEPKSALVRLHQAVLLSTTGEPKNHEADKVYAEAMQLASPSDEELRSSIRSWWIRTKIDLGQHLEAYRIFSDKEATFKQLAGTLHYSDEKQLDELIQLHEIKFNHDPQVHYYKGLLATKKKDYAAAEVAFAQAFSLAKEENDLASIRYARINAQYHAGNITHAYDTSDAPDEAFSQLARQLLNDEKAAEVLTLAKRHEAKSPNDGWLHFHVGRANVMLKNFAQAETAFIKADKLIDDEYDKNYVLSERIHARLTAGKTISDFDDLKPRDNVFQQLKSHFIGQKDATQLRQLVQRFGNKYNYWLIEADYIEKKYAAVAQQLPANKDNPEAAAWHYDDRLIRSLTFLKRHDDVKAHIATTDKYDRDWYLTLFHILTGDVQQSIKAMTKLESDGNGDDASYFYDDEDTGPILKTEAFKPFRNKFPMEEFED